MNYQRLPIALFTGLNNSTHSTAIKDSDAQDLVNLRVLAVGKLVSRDGVALGINLAASTLTTDFKSLTGICGIAEYVAEDRIGDSYSKVMVYVGRKSDGTAQLFYAPLHGASKDTFVSLVGDSSLARSTKFYRYPQGKWDTVFNAQDIIAPPESALYRNTNSIAQYRHHLLVANPSSSGDMRLVNTVDTVAGQSFTPNYILASNTTPLFVSPVNVNYLTAADQANGAGKKTGLALQKFELQKKYTQVSSTKHEQVTLGANDSLPPAGDLSSYSSIVLSSAKDRQEFNSLLDPLQLPIDEYDRTDITTGATTRIRERVLDVWKWDDFQVTYKPCSGVQLDTDNYRMRGRDKYFDKLTAGTVRLTDVSVPDGAADAQLTVWKYRFAWQFKDGSTSYASNEFFAQDILWSVVSDATVSKTGANGFSYTRPHFLDESRLRLTKSQAINANSDYNTLYQDIFNKLYPASSNTTKETQRQIIRDNSVCVHLLCASEALRTYGVVINAYDVSGSVTSQGLTRDNFRQFNFAVQMYAGRIRDFNALNSGAPIPTVGRTNLRGLFNGKPTSASPLQLKGSLVNVPTYTPNDALAFANPHKVYDDRYESSFGKQENPILFAVGYGAGLDTDIPVSLVYGSKKQEDAFTNIDTAKVPAQVYERLILSGVAELEVCRDNSVIESLAQSTYYVDDIAQRPNGTGGNRIDSAIDVVKDLTTEKRFAQDTKIYLYLNGTRLCLHEQLTAFIPSSVLFEAPCVELQVDAEMIPPNAEKLLVYRTKNAHANDFTPLGFGLVKEIPVKENQEVKFYDDVKDNAINFGLSPTRHNALFEPLQSAHVAVIGELAVFGNYAEYNYPIAPLTQSSFTIPNSQAWYCVQKDAEGVYSKASIPLDYVYGTTTVLNIPSPTDAGCTVEVLYCNGTNVRSVATLTHETYSYGLVAIPNAVRDTAPIMGTVAEVNAILSPKLRRYESEYRIAQPYEPYKFNPSWFGSVRRGDGDEITGMVSHFGNLLIFKQRSIHRIALQGKSFPVSRVDEVSPDVGCIAPRTLITVNNTVFFLSNKGLTAYNNNSITNIDTLFNEELMYRIYGLGAEGKELATYSSCGYNQEYNELYLNVPSYKPVIAEAVEGTQRTENTRKLRGHIYVLSLTKGIVSKFAYASCTNDTTYSKTTQLRSAKLYYANSEGELRSADRIAQAHTTALAYCESPSNRNSDEAVGSTLNDNVLVKSYWQSKDFTGNDETLIKRVRAVAVNLFAEGDTATSNAVATTIRTNSAPRGKSNNDLAPVQQSTFEFTSSIATNSNTFTVVPQTTDVADGWDDDKGKPQQFSVEIESLGRVKLNGLTIEWRPTDMFIP